jgi:hypothetical protein
MGEYTPQLNGYYVSKIVVQVFLMVFMLGLSSCQIKYKGQLVNASTAKPIQEVEIILENYTCFPSIQVQTKTDKNGYFEIAIPRTMNSCIDPNKITISIVSDQYKVDRFELIRNQNNILKIASK